jgi:aryl-alcohol dehydrogenase-like predicted oxidoreductase
MLFRCKRHCMTLVGTSFHARYWHEREFETVARVQEIAKQHGTPIATLSVAWVLANPAITSAIFGASRIEQLTDTLGRRGLQTRQRIENEF